MLCTSWSTEKKENLNVYVVKNTPKLRKKRKKDECSKKTAETVCECCKMHIEIVELKGTEAAECDGCVKHTEHILKNIKQNWIYAMLWAR